jgi:uncharacterized protein (UPF0332 family)
VATIITISGRVAEKLRRRAEELGLAPEELILNILTENLDPEQRAREYIEAALDLLKEAEEELEKGDLRQASEKIWGACALAIKAHALARRGLRLESHRDLWTYKSEVARELGEWVKVAFREADSMRKNFYEGLATREDVEDTPHECSSFKDYSRRPCPLEAASRDYSQGCEEATARRGSLRCGRGCGG